MAKNKKKKYIIRGIVFEGTKKEKQIAKREIAEIFGSAQSKAKFLNVNE